MPVMVLNKGLGVLLLGALAVFSGIPTMVDPISAQTNIPLTCANGRAVADPVDNPRLVGDCEALLASRDRLAGTAALNWSADVPMEEWYGIMLEGRPLHVHELNLNNSGLTGILPEELGRLTNLKTLWLANNQLTGEIPTELGYMPYLRWLDLGDNCLTGSIPETLSRVTYLRVLSLGNNELSGNIPPELGLLANLHELNLSNNQLTGGYHPKSDASTNLNGCTSRTTN